MMKLTDAPTFPPESVTYFVISDTIPKRSLPTALITNRLDAKFLIAPPVALDDDDGILLKKKKRASFVVFDSQHYMSILKCVRHQSPKVRILATQTKRSNIPIKFY